MADVTLFHIWPSLCSQKARLALAEKGVAYQGRIVNIGPPMENYEPWYVRMNPAAVVPTLKHGETVVTDSLRIVRYVDEAFPGPALTPEEPEARAAQDALLERIDRLQIRTISYAPRRERVRGLVAGVVGLRARRLRRLARDNPDLREAYERKLRDVEGWRAAVLDPSAAEAARAEVVGVLDALEASLEARGGPFVLGERYTLADVLATTLAARVRMLGRGELVSSRPRLAAWYERVRARPSFAAASMAERVEVGKMAAIMLPWVLPRLAAAALAVGLLAWGVARLLRAG